MNRSNRSDAPNPTESGHKFEEVSAFDVVREIVAITVDSGAAKSVWPSREKGVTSTTATKMVRLTAGSGDPIRVEGDARLEFVRDGRKCTMKFFGC